MVSKSSWYIRVAASFVFCVHSQIFTAFNVKPQFAGPVDDVVVLKSSIHLCGGLTVRVNKNFSDLKNGISVKYQTGTIRPLDLGEDIWVYAWAGDSGWLRDEIPGRHFLMGKQKLRPEGFTVRYNDGGSGAKQLRKVGGVLAQIPVSILGWSAVRSAVQEEGDVSGEFILDQISPEFLENVTVGVYKKIKSDDPIIVYNIGCVVKGQDGTFRRTIPAGALLSLESIRHNKGCVIGPAGPRTVYGDLGMNFPKTKPVIDDTVKIEGDMLTQLPVSNQIIGFIRADSSELAQQHNWSFDITVGKNSDSLLLYALKKKKFNAARTIIKNRKGYFFKNNNLGLDAVFYAVEHNLDEIAKMLITPKTPEKKYGQGNTILHQALINKSEILLRHITEVMPQLKEIKNDKGLTPRDLAKELGYKGAAGLLK